MLSCVRNRVNHVWEQLDQGTAYCLNCPAVSGMGHVDNCMNPFDFFERKVCLTLGPDWPQACTEFERVGLTDVWRFDAIPDIGPHQSFSRSVRQILEDFMVSGSKTLLHMEDDCIFQPLDHLALALSELPENWDIVYLGANLLCWGHVTDPQPERLSKHLFRVRQAWCTHAIGFNRKIVPFILEHQPGFSEQMIDNWLSAQLPRLNAYVVAPMVAYQRARHSAIWGRYDDYTPIFKQSEAKLI
jgi:hypothetical protein